MNPATITNVDQTCRTFNGGPINKTFSNAVIQTVNGRHYVRSSYYGAMPISTSVDAVNWSDITPMDHAGRPLGTGNIVEGPTGGIVAICSAVPFAYNQPPINNFSIYTLVYVNDSATLVKNNLPILTASPPNNAYTHITTKLDLAVLSGVYVSLQIEKNKLSLYKSSDCIVWEKVTIPAQMETVTSGNLKIVSTSTAFYILPSSGMMYSIPIWKSTDGVNWTELIVPFIPKNRDGSDFQAMSLKVINDRLFLLGSNIFSSSDGLDWAPVPILPGSDKIQLYQDGAFNGTTYFFVGSGMTNMTYGLCIDSLTAGIPIPTILATNESSWFSNTVTSNGDEVVVISFQSNQPASVFYNYAATGGTAGLDVTIKSLPTPSSSNLRTTSTTPVLAAADLTDDSISGDYDSIVPDTESTITSMVGTFTIKDFLATGVILVEGPDISMEFKYRTTGSAPSDVYEHAALLTNAFNAINNRIQTMLLVDIRDDIRALSNRGTNVRKGIVTSSVAFEDSSSASS